MQPSVINVLTHVHLQPAGLFNKRGWNNYTQEKLSLYVIEFYGIFKCQYLNIYSPDLTLYISLQN